MAVATASGDVPAAGGDLPACRRLLIWAGGLLYLAYALITPPFQTPDEQQHLFRAWQLAQGQLHGERRGDQAGGMVPAGLVRAVVAEIGNADPLAVRPVPKRPVAEMFARSTPLAADEPRIFANFLGGVLYSPAGYLPQIAAVRIGASLGLSVEAIVRLARILNAALALGLFLLALSILPVGRIHLVLLALLPMSGAASASMGQDGIILGSCAVLVALGVRARFDKGWTSSSLLLLGLCAAVIGLSKMVYLPLLAIALVPMPHAARQLAWFGGPLLLLGLGALLSALWLKVNQGVVVPMGTGIAQPGAQLGFVLAHPFDFLATLGRTLLVKTPEIVLYAFTFGWLTVGPVLPAALLALAALALSLRRTGAPPPELAGLWRIWAALVALVVAVGIATAMYLAASPLGAAVVEGLQGRYFLPLLPLFAIAVTPSPAGAAWGWRAVLLMVGANCAALAGIAGAFYSV